MKHGKITIFKKNNHININSLNYSNSSEKLNSSNKIHHNLMFSENYEHFVWFDLFHCHASRLFTLF